VEIFVWYLSSFKSKGTFNMGSLTCSSLYYSCIDDTIDVIINKFFSFAIPSMWVFLSVKKLDE
jgi:hypothetical protein